VSSISAKPKNKQTNKNKKQNPSHAINVAIDCDGDADVSNRSESPLPWAPVWGRRYATTKRRPSLMDA
jgi:hypothetical protein